MERFTATGKSAPRILSRLLCRLLAVSLLTGAVGAGVSVPARAAATHNNGPQVSGFARVGNQPHRALHPDGGQPSTKGVIVWTNRTDDGSEHLLVARADGSHQRSLTAAVPDGSDIDAQISPDGSWVAYEHATPDTSTIHLVRPDATHDHGVDLGCVDPCIGVGSPTWLSNSRIAFSLVKGPIDPQTGNAASVVLWSARLDGSDVRRLSQPGIEGIFEDTYLRVSPRLPDVQARPDYRHRLGTANSRI